MALPLINGENYTSASVQLMIPLLGAVIGVTEISYSKEQQIDDNYSLGQDPTSRGYGQNKYTGRITMYKDVWNRIIDLSPSKDPLLLLPFDIAVVYTKRTGGYRKEILRAVNFKNNPVTVNAGDTKLLVSIDLAVGNIDFV